MKTQAFEVVLVDKSNMTHVAEVLTREEYEDEGKFGCETIARNYAAENDLQFRNWKVQAV